MAEPTNLVEERTCSELRIGTSTRAGSMPFLARLHPNVEWANGMEGGHVLGREGVRAYWTRQWATIDPHVEPLAIRPDDQGGLTVEVHQVVRDLRGVLMILWSIMRIDLPTSSSTEWTSNRSYRRFSATVAVRNCDPVTWSTTATSSILISRTGRKPVRALPLERSRMTATTPIGEADLEFDHGSFDAAGFTKQTMANWQALAAVIDHTLLKPEATREQVEISATRWSAIDLHARWSIPSGRRLRSVCSRAQVFLSVL